MKNKLILCILLMSTIISMAYGQGSKISGTVKDGTGEPLIGVSVLVKSTTNGVITDFDGNYTLSNVPKNSTLVFSYVGMISQEIKVTNQKVINVILKDDSKTLDEVVVIGFGTTSKRKAVGSISTIGGDKISKTSFENVGQAIQGQVPGLVVNSAGGQPGKAPTISIRGAGTPMYVIDGVISDEYAFSSINPSDIDQISFLKDASSTAVYGSRAGDGIVLVKTKRGKSGTMSVNYSNNLQFSQPTVLADMLSSYDLASIENEVAGREGRDLPYTTDVLNAYRDQTDPYKYPNSNWRDLAVRKTVFSQRHNLSLNGGSENTNYYVSFGYLGNNGIYKSGAVDLEQYNMRSNVTTNFDKIGLKLETNLNANLQTDRQPEAGELSAWRNIPFSPMSLAYNPDGTYGSWNVLVLTDPTAYLKTRKKYTDAQMRLTWKLPWVKGLSIQTMGNYKESDTRIKDWKVIPPYYERGSSVATPVAAPSLKQSSQYNSYFDTELGINYDNTFGKHTISALLLYSARREKMEILSASRMNYQSSVIDEIFAGSSIGKDNEGHSAEGANAGYVGRLKYDYNARYILEFSGRYDGNDNFAKNKRWGFFPALSGVWMISDESFMDFFKEKHIVDYLKLRASTGKTGITNNVTRFGYIPTYSMNSNIYSVDGSLVNGFTEGELVDPNNLTWYTRNTQNIGFDFASLNNRLEGSFDYFYYTTTGYIVSPQNIYSQTLGKGLPKVKSNSKHRRAGFEATLKFKDKKGDFSYEIGGNVSYYNQLWEQKDDENEATLKNPYLRITHQKDYFGSDSNQTSNGVYLSNGLYQTSDEILNTARFLASTSTSRGDIRYKDANGDGKIDQADLRRIGKPVLPHLNYGFNFLLKYKNLSLTGLIQGTGDRYCLFGGRFQRGDAQQVRYEFQKDYWRPDNTDAEFPRLSNQMKVNGGNNFQITDLYIMNAKYIRLKSLQIGYDLKNAVLKNVPFIKGCNLTLSGTNLLTLSDVMDYFDPESTMNTFFHQNQSSLESYPVMRTYSIGLNVNF